MKYFVIKSEWNWADEMDVETLEFVTEDELLEMREDVKKVKEKDPTAEVETYVGTNEEVVITISEVEDYVNGKGYNTVIKEISEETYNELKFFYVNETIFDLFFDFYGDD